MQGQYNFDRVVFDYYRDQSVALEAFKSGGLHAPAGILGRHLGDRLRLSGRRVGRGDAGNAAARPAIGHARLRLQHPARPVRRPPGARGADPRLRLRLGEPQPASMGSTSGSTAFFANSDLAPAGRPEGLELELLEAQRDRVRPEVFDEPYQPPSTEGGSVRANLAAARNLLAEAGWSVENGALTREGPAIRLRGSASRRERGEGGAGLGRQPAPPRHPGRRADGRFGAVPGSDRHLRLRRDPVALDSSPCRRARSRTSIGAAIPRRQRAAATMRAFRTPPSMR